MDGGVDHTLDIGPSDRVEASPRFAAGTTIGHFRVIGALGEGGMGLVVEAHDPDLDRRVAIKVVRDHTAGSAAGQRLIGEAQAMARLTHPNVVAVHEVGTIDDQVFVVMELVRGETLAAWLAHPRPWRDIVATFVQAGDGLLAAHHAGLVHRDFKPTNVLVDTTGRARVSDFGLAHSDDQQRFARGSEGSSGVAGTPAYMAPEQRAGEAVDARADQYAFAVSLQHALSPKHALGTPPRRIKNAIARALAIDPDARFPSLDELLTVLRHSMRRRTAIVAGLAAGAVAAGAALAIPAARGSDECTAGAELVDTIWTPEARAVQRGRFLVLRPRAAPSIDAAHHVVDDWANAWKLGRRAACATSGDERATRLACLDHQLHELRAQLAVWSAADGAVVDQVMRTAAGLGQPGDCVASGIGALDPKVRDLLVENDALVRSGRAPAAKQKLEPLLAAATATANPRDLAAALISAGKVERETGDYEHARDHLSRASREAGRANDDFLLLEALMREASVIVDLGHPRDSLGLLDAAEAIDTRTAQHRAAEIGVLRGDALEQAGKATEAIATLQALLPEIEARAARDPRDRITLSTLLGQLAAANLLADHRETARVALVRALAIDEGTFGPDHPEVAKTLHDLAHAELQLGKFDDSRAHLGRATAIFRNVYGEHHTMLGACYLTTAKLAEVTGKLDDALVAYEHARTAFAGVLPADHAWYAVLESGIGEILRTQDKCKQAIPYFERALAIYEQDGADPKSHALQLTNLGACQLDAGERTTARRTLERSLAELEQTHQSQTWFSEPYAGLADIEAAEGHKQKAIELEKKALAAIENETSADAVEMRKYEEEQLAKLTK